MRAFELPLSFELPVRVYIEDVDMGGVVYHANYIRYLERARTEWLRRLGFELGQLIESGYILVVSDLSVKYRRPAKMGDSLIVTCSAKSIGKARFSFDQHIYNELTNEHLLESVVTVCGIDAKHRRPVAIPDSLYRAIVSPMKEK